MELGIVDALAEQADDANGLAARLGLDPAGVSALLVALASLGYLERDQADDANGLAARLGLDPAGVSALLVALGSLGYLEREGGRYVPSETSRRLLASGSPESIAHFAGPFADYCYRIAGGLDEAIRGRQPAESHAAQPGDPLWEGYIRGLHELSRGEHDANAALVPVDDPRALIDVAGGHGEFAMAMCRRHPGLRATVLDLPGSVEVGRKIVEEQGFADRVSFEEGDVFEVGLGDGADVVSAFNLVHHLPPERNLELFRMARAAAGCLVIGESERPEPDADVPQVGALSGLNFYAMSGARTYSRGEIEGWMREAGFGEVAVHRNERSPWRILLVGQ